MLHHRIYSYFISLTILFHGLASPGLLADAPSQGTFPQRIALHSLIKDDASCLEKFRIPAGLWGREELSAALTAWILGGNCLELKRHNVYRHYPAVPLTVSLAHIDVTSPKLILVTFEEIGIQYMLSLSSSLPSKAAVSFDNVQMLHRPLPKDQDLYDNYIRESQGSGLPPIVFTQMIVKGSSDVAQEEVSDRTVQWDRRALEEFLRRPLPRANPARLAGIAEKMDTWFLEHRLDDAKTAAIEKQKFASLLRMMVVQQREMMQLTSEEQLTEDELQSIVLMAGEKILSAYLQRQRQIASGAWGGVKDELHYRFLTPQGLTQTTVQLGFGGVIGVAVAEAMLAAGITSATVISLPVIGSVTVGTTMVGIGVLVIGGTVYYVVATSDHAYDRWRRLTSVGVDSLAMSGGMYAGARFAAQGGLEPFANTWWRTNVRSRWPNAYPDFGFGLKPGVPSIGPHGELFSNGWLPPSRPSYPADVPRPFTPHASTATTSSNTAPAVATLPRLSRPSATTAAATKPKLSSAASQSRELLLGLPISIMDQAGTTDADDNENNRQERRRQRDLNKYEDLKTTLGEVFTASYPTVEDWVSAGRIYPTRYVSTEASRSAMGGDAAKIWDAYWLTKKRWAAELKAMILNLDNALLSCRESRLKLQSMGAAVDFEDNQIKDARLGLQLNLLGAIGKINVLVPLLFSYSRFYSTEDFQLVVADVTEQLKILNPADFHVDPDASPLDYRDVPYEFFAKIVEIVGNAYQPGDPMTAGPVNIFNAVHWLIRYTLASKALQNRNIGVYLLDDDRWELAWRDTSGAARDFIDAVNYSKNSIPDKDDSLMLAFVQEIKKELIADSSCSGQQFIQTLHSRLGLPVNFILADLHKNLPEGDKAYINKIVVQRSVLFLIVSADSRSSLSDRNDLLGWMDRFIERHDQHDNDRTEKMNIFTRITKPLRDWVLRELGISIDFDSPFWETDLERVFTQVSSLSSDKKNEFYNHIVMQNLTIARFLLGGVDHGDGKAFFGLWIAPTGDDMRLDIFAGKESWGFPKALRTLPSAGHATYNAMKAIAEKFADRLTSSERED